MEITTNCFYDQADGSGTARKINYDPSLKYK
jgi:hypothetical protein